MSLWNPYASTIHGQPAQLGAAPPVLRVMGGEATAEQLAAARVAFSRFCSVARTSPVPNPTEIGQLPDGSAYRIVVVGVQSFMEIWPKGVAAAGIRLSGIAFQLSGDEHLQENGDRISYILTPSRNAGGLRTTGKWHLQKVASIVGGTIARADTSGDRYYCGWGRHYERYEQRLTRTNEYTWLDLATIEAAIARSQSNYPTTSASYLNSIDTRVGWSNVGAFLTSGGNVAVSININRAHELPGMPFKVVSVAAPLRTENGSLPPPITKEYLLPGVALQPHTFTVNSAGTLGLVYGWRDGVGSLVYEVAVDASGVSAISAGGPVGVMPLETEPEISVPRPPVYGQYSYDGDGSVISVIYEGSSAFGAPDTLHSLRNQRRRVKRNFFDRRGKRWTTDVVVTERRELNSDAGGRTRIDIGYSYWYSYPPDGDPVPNKYASSQITSDEGWYEETTVTTVDNPRYGAPEVVTVRERAEVSGSAQQYVSLVGFNEWGGPIYSASGSASGEVQITRTVTRENIREIVFDDITLDFFAAVVTDSSVTDVDTLDKAFYTNLVGGYQYRGIRYEGAVRTSTSAESTTRLELVSKGTVFYSEVLPAPLPGDWFEPSWAYDPATGALLVCIRKRRDLWTIAQWDVVVDDSGARFLRDVISIGQAKVLRNGTFQSV